MMNLLTVDKVMQDDSELKGDEMIMDSLIVRQIIENTADEGVLAFVDLCTYDSVKQGKVVYT